tara:strand:+ start:774 stop:2003 length:1230 start_codon:yes stop_codon:yes gene_type:complete
MRIIITILCILISFNSLAQEVTYTEAIKIKKKESFIKELYKDFLKYGTFYAAGNIGSAYETQRPNYFVRTDPDNLYAIPDVVDQTIYHPFDYRYGLGIRKLARFDYEVKGTNFYNGTEDNVALAAPSAAIKGLEYLIHYEKERKRGEEWVNSRFFVRHTGDNHIIKLEQREQGNVGFKYQSAEARARLPIGKKFSISAGAIYRTHEKAYGYNPIEIWLNETDDNGLAANPWYTLGYEYGYYDTYYVANYYDQDGNFIQFPAWFWMDENDVLVAHTDEVFRDEVFPDLMNRYNNEIWDTLNPYGEIAPIIGADFYHFKNKFWLHAYANWILPYHEYLKGDEDFSYLNRDNWGKGGLIQDSTPEQWSDYQAGVMFGWKVSRSFGIFVEGEYTKFWDSEIYNTNFGLNITFK